MYPWCIVNLSNSTFYIKITTSFVISELFGFYSSLFGAIVVDLHCLIRRAILIFHEQWEDFACLCVSWFYALVSWYDYVPLKFSYRTCLIRKKTFFSPHEEYLDHDFMRVFAYEYEFGLYTICIFIYKLLTGFEHQRAMNDIFMYIIMIIYKYKLRYFLFIVRYGQLKKPQ